MPDPISESPSAPGIAGRMLWPGLVFVLLGGQVLVMFVMVYLATSDGSFAIEPDYYQKGLNWDVTADQLRENKRLGWAVRMELGDEASVLGERTVRCTLTDPSGQALDGAIVDLVAFAHARGGERSAVTLLPVGDGVYESKLRFARHGLWEFRLVVRRGPETFTHTELITIYPPGESAPWQP